MKKKFLAVILSLIMVLGSISVVSASYVEWSESVSNSSCTVYYDAYCYPGSCTASTWVYTDYTVSSVNASVNMKLYVIPAEYDSIQDEDIKDQLSTLYGSDSDYSSTVNSGLVTADAQVNHASGDVPQRVESTHTVNMVINSNDYSSTKGLETH